MENMDCTKMGADSSAENNPNAPEFICPILDFNKKGFIGRPLSVSVAIQHIHPYSIYTVRTFVHNGAKVFLRYIRNLPIYA